MPNQIMSNVEIKERGESAGDPITLQPPHERHPRPR
jgi:hypothetical protein